MKVLRILLFGGVFFVFFVLLERGWEPVPPLGSLLAPRVGLWEQAIDLEIDNEKITAVEGLLDEVTITYDSLEIPRIYATNEADMFFAQGYLHAQHRLWQMDFQARAAGGQLAEILGEALLEYDRTARRKGMRVAANHALQNELKHPAAQLALLQYTKGVNAFIETLRPKDYPLEFKLLRYKPTLWTPEKSMLLLMQMVATLSTTEYDIENTDFLLTHGEAAFNIFFPDIPSLAHPIVSKPGKWPAPMAKADSITDLWPKGFDAITRNNPFTEDVPGSNNWVVGPTKTTDSSIILCNDPHLGLQLPSLWFVNQLSQNKHRVMGASIPGLPGVVLGYNDSIAWGVTNSQRDVVDWYELLFKDAARNEYLVDHAWKKSRKEIEEIKVSRKSSVFDTVVYTEFGPVVYDAHFGGNHPKTGLAYRWIGHDTDSELAAFLALNTAKNAKEITSALSKMTSVAQNFVYATTGGDYGICLSGKYPLRHQGEGRFVRDGQHSANNWNAFVPFEGHPKQQNPQRGFVASANQHHADATYPYYQYATPYQTYRNKRINEVLDARNDWTPQQLQDFQSDNYNTLASLWLPLAIAQLPDSTLSEASQEFMSVLKSWDLENTASSTTAIYFEVFWKNFYPHCVAHWFDGVTSARYPQSLTVIQLVDTAATHTLWDNPKTPEVESVTSHLHNALQVAVAQVDSLQAAGVTAWYQHKNTTLRHLARIPQFSVPQVAIGGNANIVNANTPTHGASWRFMAVIDANGISGTGIYPGGQDGNPGSGHYTDYVDDWKNGQLLPLPLLPETTAKRRHLLKPTVL